MPIAILDTQIISNLSHPQHEAAMERLISSLRTAGFAVGVTATILQELGATSKKEKWDSHFQKIKAHLDVVIPVTRHELALTEIANGDCYRLIGEHVRPGAGFPDISELWENEELLEDVASDRAWKERIKQVLPTLDPLNAHVESEGFESFQNLVQRQEVGDAVVLLKELQVHQPFAADVTEAFAREVLTRGKAIRAVVLMSLANQYDRIERTTRGLQTKNAGSLSDAFILSEAAYFDLVVTMDEDFARAGQLFNQVVAKPVVRHFTP